MNKGKQTCELLKTIRVKLAEANGIDYHPHECAHEGPCPGTCPLCDQEIRWLQQQIDELLRQGTMAQYDVLSPEEMIFLIDSGMLTDDDDAESVDTVLMGDMAFDPLLLSDTDESALLVTEGHIGRPDDTEIAHTPSVKPSKPRKKPTAESNK